MKPNGFSMLLAEEKVEGSSVRYGRFVVIISTILAALFLYLVLYDLNWPIFFVTLKNVQYTYLPIVFFWGSLSLFLRALRLRVLLISENHLPISNVFWANMAGYFANNVLPARAGELVRATYLARKNNINISFALAVGFVEHLMDLIALIVLGSFALSLTGIISVVFRSALKVVSLFGLIGLGVVIVLPYFQGFMSRLIWVLPLLRDVHKIKIEDFFQQFLKGLKSLHSFQRVTQFTGLTGMIWLMDAIGTVFLAYILKIPLLLNQAFVLLAALGLSSAIPSTPGYVGVYQYVAVTTLAPFGVSKADALVYILISQILGYMIVGFWGIISVWRFNKYARV